MRTSNNVIHISIPGMEVYLAKFFFESGIEQPIILHRHLCYELVYVREREKMRFIINPPRVEHMSVSLEFGKVNSILFSIIPGSEDEISNIFANLTEQTEVIDCFGGASCIDAVESTVGDSGFGTREYIVAQFRLLFVSIARAVWESRKDSAPFCYPQSIDEQRVARLNDYFHTCIADPNANRMQLAAQLGVCPRQLSRILLEAYGKPYSNIMLDMRMRLAKAMQSQGHSIAEIMSSTGYVSERTFKRAYKKFFGYPFARKRS